MVEVHDAAAEAAGVARDAAAGDRQGAAVVVDATPAASGCGVPDGAPVDGDGALGVEDARAAARIGARAGGAVGEYQIFQRNGLARPDLDHPAGMAGVQGAGVRHRIGGGPTAGRVAAFEGEVLLDAGGLLLEVHGGLPDAVAVADLDRGAVGRDVNGYLQGILHVVRAARVLGAVHDPVVVGPAGELGFHRAADVDRAVHARQPALVGLALRRHIGRVAAVDRGAVLREIRLVSQGRPAVVLQRPQPEIRHLVGGARREGAPGCGILKVVAAVDHRDGRPGAPAVLEDRAREV